MHCGNTEVPLDPGATCTHTASCHHFRPRTQTGGADDLVSFFYLAVRRDGKKIMNYGGDVAGMLAAAREILKGIELR